MKPACILYLLLALLLSPAWAQESCGDDGLALSRSHDSGARWQLCARIDEHHGLELYDIHYQAPGDRLRQVLDTLHLAQILWLAHDAPEALPLIGRRLQAASGLGGTAIVPASPNTCADNMTLSGIDGALCSQHLEVPMLARGNDSPELVGHRWRLGSDSRRGFSLWRTEIDLGEDGSITPRLSLLELPASERREGVSILASWRMVFALDGEASSSIVEMTFPLQDDQGNTRPGQQQLLTRESFRQLNREQFTRWQIVGTQGHYLLDPANQGFAWDGPGGLWTHSDLALSRYRACERLASENTSCQDTSGESLDDFVDDESLTAGAALWLQQTRTLPAAIDNETVPQLPMSFTLLPFDWTNESPFEVRLP